MTWIGWLRGRLGGRDPLWAVYPTARLAAVAGVAAPLWLLPGATGRAIAIGATIALAAAVLVDLALLPTRRALTVTRESPDIVGLADPFELTYEVRSDWWAPTEVSVHQEVPSAIEAPLAEDGQRVKSRSGFSLRVRAVAHRRGRYPLGRIALSVRSRLGVLRRIVRTSSDGSVLVVPSLSNVRRFRLLALQNRLTDAGIRALRMRGEGQSLAGLREYVPGDDPRMIDWKSTARHARLIMREHTVERAQTVISLVDCGRSMTQLSDGYSRLEHVLSAALLLTDVAATGGDHVGLMAFDDSIRLHVPPRRGRAALRAVREGLIGLGATMTEPDYASAFRLLALRQRRRALVVFFTDVIDLRASRALIAYLGRAAQRHAVVVVAIKNEELLLASRPKPEAGSALYLNAAAEELVRERSEALARMRQAGVTVLDVAPTQIATSVVNRYLEVKARGLL